MKFGDKLREIRLNWHMTQKDVGKAIGKTGATICDWEKGKSEPSLSELEMLADMFHVTTDYLLGRWTPYAAFKDFVANYDTDKEHIGYVTLVKKFSPQNMAQLNKLVSFLRYNEAQDTLLHELFRSVGYRIDRYPPEKEEWEEPELELTEQRELRLNQKRMDALGKSRSGR